MNSRTLHIHVDRVVVEGLPAREQQRFVRALEQQLTSMAAEGIPGAFTGGRARRIASLDAGQLRAGATPEQAAGQVTTALRGGLAPKGGNRHA